MVLFSFSLFWAASIATISWISKKRNTRRNYIHFACVGEVLIKNTYNLPLKGNKKQFQNAGTKSKYQNCYDNKIFIAHSYLKNYFYLHEKLYYTSSDIKLCVFIPFFCWLANTLTLQITLSQLSNNFGMEIVESLPHFSVN